ncbi:MAG: hypothetical protein CR986_00570 [Ignavibacteriae bacterium]|nr:MAG: hypothetical protein CR986_00570 [Ignavibacteriota bacterium]
MEEIQEQQINERLKHRFTIEGNSLFDTSIDEDNLFTKNDTYSANFTVLKYNNTRATLKEASIFKNFMEEVIAKEGKNIVVDLNGCEFIDSSFFGVLVSGVKRLKTMGKKYYLVFDNKDTIPIFSATGLDKVFTIYNSVKEAVES